MSASDPREPHVGESRRVAILLASGTNEYGSRSTTSDESIRIENRRRRNESVGRGVPRNSILAGGGRGSIPFIFPRERSWDERFTGRRDKPRCQIQLPFFDHMGSGEMGVATNARQCWCLGAVTCFSIYSPVTRLFQSRMLMFSRPGQLVSYIQ